MKACEQCGKPFKPIRKTHKFCSYSCSNKNRWNNPEYKERVSKSISKTKKDLFSKGELISPYFYIKNKEEWKRNVAENNGLKNGGTPWNKGKRYSRKSPNHHLRGKTYEEVYGQDKAKKLKEDHSKTMSKIASSDPNWIKHVFDNVERRPTTPEQEFIKICEKHCLPFKYVGDGSFWINGFNPDFIENNGEKICIEIFGRYWHDPNNKNIPTSSYYKNRQKIFDKAGWKCLIFWEDELDDENIFKKLGVLL